MKFVMIGLLMSAFGASASLELYNGDGSDDIKRALSEAVRTSNLRCMGAGATQDSVYNRYDYIFYTNTITRFLGNRYSVAKVSEDLDQPAIIVTDRDEKHQQTMKFYTTDDYKELTKIESVRVRFVTEEVNMGTLIAPEYQTISSVKPISEVECQVTAKE